MKLKRTDQYLLAVCILLAFGLSSVATAELIPEECQQTNPEANVRGIFGGGAGLDSIPDTFGCEIPNGSGYCKAEFYDPEVGKTYLMEVVASVLVQGSPDGLPGMKWEALPEDENFPDPPNTIRVGAIAIGTKGSSGGSDCIWSYKNNILGADGHVYVKSNGQLSGVNAGYFFANTDTTTPFRSASRCVPNCRELEAIDGLGAPPQCIGAEHTPGINESVNLVLQRKDAYGNSVPFSGWQIGSDPNPALRDVDVANFCVCNHKAVPEEGETDDITDPNYGQDCACDENFDPGVVNPVTGEVGCQIANADEPRQNVGLSVVNPWCPRGGSTNRCY